MFLLKANLDLTEKYRKRPIQGQTYRPILYFSNTCRRSGLIVLEPDEQLDMTLSYNDRLIKIYTHEDLDTNKEFFIGRQFIMAEGSPLSGLIGQGVITEIIGVE